MAHGWGALVSPLAREQAAGLFDTRCEKIWHRKCYVKAQCVAPRTNVTSRERVICSVALPKSYTVGSLRCVCGFACGVWLQKGLGWLF